MRINEIYTFILLVAAWGCGSKISDDNNVANDEITLLVGTYTGDGSEGIYQLIFGSKGTLSSEKLLAIGDSPSFLDISSENRVYAISEKNKGTISAYKYSNDTLVVMAESLTHGVHPCYVDYDEKRSLVAAANYTTGDGVIYKVDSLGLMADTLFTYRHSGKGTNTKRQEGPHAHCSVFSPIGEYMYVVDLGIDQILGYPLSGDLIGKAFVALELKGGDGPRHISFDAQAGRVFVINELSNTVVSAYVDKENGVMHLIDRKPTLPEDFIAHSQAADIHVSKDGRFLYTSNRGHNSIAVFAVLEGGQLNLLSTESVRGDWPRNFTLSPDNKYLIVANQKSDNIVVFERDSLNGLLQFSGYEYKMSKPVCLRFLNR